VRERERGETEREGERRELCLASSIFSQ
jgi:hypothetical protein